MPTEAGTQVTSQRGFGLLEELNDPKRIRDLGSRLRGNEEQETI
jgi:hypothetical protein